MSNEDAVSLEKIEKLNKLIEARNLIVHYPDDGLNKPAEEVDYAKDHIEVTGKIRLMTSTMMALEAYGIAGPQIGFNYRVCVCWLNERSPEDVLVMINPEIVSLGGSWVNDKEGCLSLPKVQGNVLRRNTIVVKYYDMDNFLVEETYQGWNARIIQHELDHLNGKLISSRFDPPTYLANRKHLEYMQLRTGELPERLRRKGKALKNERI